MSFNAPIPGLKYISTHFVTKKVEKFFGRRWPTVRRLQRMRLTLRRYDLRVNYIPGSKSLIADALSRAPTAAPASKHLRLECEDCKTRAISRVSDELLLRIEITLNSDPDGILLRKAVSTNDWSKHPLLDSFRAVRDHLFVEDGVISHAQTCYIPPSLPPLSPRNRGNAETSSGIDAEELLCGEPTTPSEIVHQDLMEWEGWNFPITRARTFMH